MTRTAKIVGALIATVGLTGTLGCQSIAKPHPSPAELPLLSGSLPERVRALHPRVNDFFYTPHSELDRSMYETGLLHHWQMYQKTEKPDPQTYLGYILYADPYHRGMKRISFLLGTDCSNFVHRFYQMLGAEFRYLKTRHWIHLGKAKTSNSRDYYARQNRGETPIDLKRCEWDTVSRQFTLVKDLSTLQPGDVVVYPKAEGILGTKGHMGLVARVDPIVVLQSKYPVGIVELPLETQGEVYAFRWTGELKSVRGRTVADLMVPNYSESIAGCAGPGGSAP